MIISGFPCIGKSSVANPDFGVIDLESSMLFVEGKRPDNWVKIYINYAEDLSKQGYEVMVSSHKEVREEMKLRNIEFYSIYPAKDLFGVWKERLQSRYNEFPTEKNKRAMDYILSHFEESIDDMSLDKNPIEIVDGTYDLVDIIWNLKDLDNVDSKRL